MEQPVPDKPEPHDITVVEVKGFARAHCSCGWQGSGFRSRSSAREQALDHSAASRRPGS